MPRQQFSAHKILQFLYNHHPQNKIQYAYNGSSIQKKDIVMIELNLLEMEQVSAAGRIPVDAIKRIGAEIGIGVVSGMVWDSIKAGASAAEGWLNNQKGNYESSSCANGGYCGGAR